LIGAAARAFDETNKEEFHPRDSQPVGSGRFSAVKHDWRAQFVLYSQTNLSRAEREVRRVEEEFQRRRTQTAWTPATVGDESD
jgi:hypothetical protein